MLITIFVTVINDVGWDTFSLSGECLMTMDITRDNSAWFTVKHKAQDMAQSFVICHCT